MAEQTKKSFLKQPKVFLSTKLFAKEKAPRKAGTHFWKNVGLGFKTPWKPLKVEEEAFQPISSAHVSPAFHVKEGDKVIIGQCR